MISQSSPLASYLGDQAGIDSAIRRVMESGWYILGSEVAAFETEFSNALLHPWTVGVANGTDAIELGLRALGVESGDRVITVSHTAVATASAIRRIGALPIFVDIDRNRYTMCPDSLEEALDSPSCRGAKAIVPVHLYGQPADMTRISALAHDRNLAVLEDCAQAHGAIVDGIPVGAWGNLGSFSFYPTKNLGAFGDGGAIVGSDETLLGSVKLLREYGWEERYISKSSGFNSRLDELQAAILRVKLPRLPYANSRRRQIAERYDSILAATTFVPPWKVPGTEHAYHQYVIRTDRRDQVRKLLEELGIHTLIHYPRAVHQQPAFSHPHGMPVPLTNTEYVVPRILSLPMYPELTPEQVNAVCTALVTCSERLQN